MMRLLVLFLALTGAAFGQGLGLNRLAADYLVRGKIAASTQPTPTCVAAVNRLTGRMYTRGNWQHLKDAAILGGVPDLNWCLVKLVSSGTNPAVLTNVNFVGGDYNVSGTAIGLIGDGSTKYLSTGAIQNVTLSQDDASIGVYLTGNITLTTFLGSQSNVQLNKSGGGDLQIRACSSTLDTVVATGFGLRGTTAFSRSASGSYAWINNSISGTATRTSAALAAQEICVFARSGPSSHTSSRLSFYWIGNALDLAGMRADLDEYNATFGFTP